MLVAQSNHGVKRKRISAAVKATFAIVAAESKNYKNTWKYVNFRWRMLKIERFVGNSMHRNQ